VRSKSPRYTARYSIVQASEAQSLVGTWPEQSPNKEAILCLLNVLFGGWVAQDGDPAGLKARSGPLLSRNQVM
jgi:hypothetical protein